MERLPATALCACPECAGLGQYCNLSGGINAQVGHVGPAMPRY
jgi:hypothetical protein